MYIDTIEAGLIIILAFIMLTQGRKERKRIQLTSQRVQDVEKFKLEKHAEFQKQMIVISIFYLIASISEWVYVRQCYEEIVHGNLVCVNDDFLISVNDRGTLILFYNTVVTYVYAAVMIWVFYFIPRR